MEIGVKLKNLRIKNGLTQKELADRAELSKGFISQMENDLTSPSIATLTDVLLCLGTDLKSFFSDDEESPIVFKKKDIFESIDEKLKNKIEWLIPNAQKNSMEPIMISIEKDGLSDNYDPNHGETYGYVLKGNIWLIYGQERLRVKKGESFYFKNEVTYCLKNVGNTEAKVLWVTTPPSF